MGSEIEACCDAINAHLATAKVVQYAGWSSRRPVRALVCADGFEISVQASDTHYCTPRDNYGPWYEVECGFPTQPVPSLAEWKDGDGDDTRAVFGYVPVRTVAALLLEHGGIKATKADGVVAQREEVR
jgi:hypothetical protein